MAKIRKRTFAKLEEIVEDYPQMNNYIKRVEEELMTPWKEQDSNIGGGRSSLISAPTEQKAITIATDKYLRKLIEQKEAMDKVVGETRDETLKIIELRYWENPRKLTWEGIAIQCHYSARHCRTLRNDFIERLGRELGEVI